MKPAAWMMRIGGQDVTAVMDTARVVGSHKHLAEFVPLYKLDAIADAVEEQDIILCLDGGWDVGSFIRRQAEEQGA